MSEHQGYYGLYPGAVRIVTRIRHDYFHIGYELGELGAAFVKRDPFHQAPLTYYWENARLALLPSAEQYAIRKRENAPST